MKDYYEILEVNKKASKEIIQKVFKIQIKKYHPDVAKEENKKAAEEKVKELNEAYEVLSNDDKRNVYDTQLECDKSSDTNLIKALSDENAILKNKLNEQYNLINDYIEKNSNINFNQVYTSNTSDEKNDNYTNLQESYSTGKYIKDTLFKLILTILLIFIGMLAISLITGINLFNDFFKTLF